MSSRARAGFLGSVLAAASWIVLGGGAAANETANGPQGSRERSDGNVIVVTIDGLRWQELFEGADSRLMNREFGKVRDVDALQRSFAAESSTLRRKRLMPFFWSEIAVRGLVFGNADDGSAAVLTNDHCFSYPGYSELLCGRADPAIDSNNKVNNPNVTVLEWLNQQPDFRGSVAAFCCWDVFPFIINQQRSGVPVNAGWQSLAATLPDDDELEGLDAARRRLQELDRVAAQLPRVWHNVRYDYLTFRAAEEYLRLKKPRVLYLSFGETDDWAHEGRYDLYLDAAHRNDQYLKRLWSLLQSIPEYKGNTTLVLTTDHGRGAGRSNWTSHGSDIEGCHRIWMAALGPNVDSNADRPAEVTLAQIAATIAEAVGQDFRADHPAAALPLPIFNHLRRGEGK